MHSFRRTTAIVLVPIATLALTSCAGGTGSSASADPSTTAASPSELTSAEPSAAAPELVGTWTRTQDCEAMLAAFEEAGLAESQSEWIVGNWVGDPAEVEVDPDSLCAGARPAEHHSHFFTADGGFGSTTTAANRLITATTRSSTLEFSSAASSSCSNRLRSSARTTAGRAIRQVGIAAALMHAPTAIFSGEAAADDHASDSRHNSVAPPVAAGRDPYHKA